MKGASSSSSSSQSSTANQSKQRVPLKIKGAKGPLFFEENEFKTQQIVLIKCSQPCYYLEWRRDKEVHSAWGFEWNRALCSVTHQEGRSQLAGLCNRYTHQSNYSTLGLSKYEQTFWRRWWGLYFGVTSKHTSKLFILIPLENSRKGEWGVINWGRSRVR